MDQLINYIDKLKLSLSNSKVITNLVNCKKNVYKNKDLIELVKKYNDTKDSKIRYEVYKNKEFMRYKQCETDVNLLIMEINNRLKIISNSGGCNESN